LEGLLALPSECKLPFPSSAESPDPVSADELAEAETSADKLEEAVEFSKVRFFFGTSTHSVISITASARSKVSTPLLLKEKCRFALIGAERFRDEYLQKGRVWRE